MAHILIIEDHALMGQLYTSALHQSDPSHEISLVYTGEEGIREAIRNPPDLVILDIILPGISGTLVAQELQEADILPRTPLIVATGIKDADAQTIAQMLNATDLLNKPFHLRFLLDAVRRALAGSD